MKALGIDTGISTSEVSRICCDLDKHVRELDLKDVEFPYMFPDAA
ncbi:MAG: hypothetical protein WC054_08985 [Candidatus Nanopelagicales bacterium]